MVWATPKTMAFQTSQPLLPILANSRNGSKQHSTYWVWYIAMVFQWHNLMQIWVFKCNSFYLKVVRKHSLKCKRGTEYSPQPWAECSWLHALMCAKPATRSNPSSGLHSMHAPRVWIYRESSCDINWHSFSIMQMQLKEHAFLMVVFVQSASKFNKLSRYLMICLRWF